MRTFSIIAVLFITIIIIIAAISAVYLTEEDKDVVTGINIDKPKQNNDDDSEDQDDGDGIPVEETKHTVFIEEGTATWCVNCPNVAETIHELYESGDYNFYYVSMIDDRNDLAEERLKDDYNIYGYPTVFIDGGYNVISGEKSKTEFANGIIKAQLRDVPELKISINITYNNDSNSLETKVNIKNNEESKYQGSLKVYLTEKVSRWVNRHMSSDNELVPYHFGFLDYIIERNIEINVGENRTYTDTSKLTEFAVPDIVPEEIMAIAVVFSSNSVSKYSYPDDNIGEFNAFYADATAASELVEGGNAPPIVGFTSPDVGKINFFNLPLINTFFGNTYLIGRSTIEVTAEDDDEVVKVEFYIDNELVFEDEEAPYEYSFRKIDMLKHIIRKRTIKIVAIDSDDRSSSTYFDAFTIFL